MTKNMPSLCALPADLSANIFSATINVDGPNNAADVGAWKQNAMRLGMIRATCTKLSHQIEALSMAICVRHAGLKNPLATNALQHAWLSKQNQIRGWISIGGQNDYDLHDLVQFELSALAGFRIHECCELKSGSIAFLSMTDIPLLLEPSWHRSLGSLDHIPAQAFLAHAPENPLLEISSGSELKPTAIGGNQNFRTAAQLPPSPGDHFCHTFYLAKGSYSVAVRGGTNPMHGKMKLLLDGQVIEATQDWSSAITAFPVTQYVHDIVVKTSGQHRLEGVVSAGERGSWMCLTEFVFRRTEVQQEIDRAHAEAFQKCGPICSEVMTQFNAAHGDGLLSPPEVLQALALVLAACRVSEHLRILSTIRTLRFPCAEELFHLALSMGNAHGLIQIEEYAPALASAMALRNTPRAY